MICRMFFFFFSSRRRHTRWTGDWSSDVCSSDVAVNEEGQTRVHDRFVLSSPVAGRLMRVSLEDGDTVQRNELVARIEPVPLSQREREEVYAREIGRASCRERV